MFKQYIGGELVDGLGPVLNVINPATDEIVDSSCGASAAQALQALEAARDAFPSWSRLPVTERVNWMAKLKQAMLNEKDTLVKLLSAEAGKSPRAAEGDFNTFMGYLDYYMSEVLSVKGVSIPEQSGPLGGTYHIVEKRPAGVVVAHLPWNFPLYAAAAKIGPSMASGCTCVVKPSSQTPLATLYIGVLAQKIGLPAGVINILCGSASVLGKVLNGSKIPRMITLVGSVDTGVQVLSEGSTSIKKYSLELGGNAPVIIMEDADLELAVGQTIFFKTFGSGQVCLGYNRIYVHETVYGEYCKRIAEELKKIKVGYHSDGIELGPLISHEARDRMLDLIKDAIDKGAKLVYGGEIPTGFEKGSFIIPALVTGVDKNMRLFQEEIFGPIIAVKSYSDFDEVLKEAAECDLGLSSYLFGHDSRAIMKALENIGAGELLVNGAEITPYVPHVGIKQSGVGCNGSSWSLEEYYDIIRLSLKP